MDILSKPWDRDWQTVLAWGPDLVIACIFLCKPYFSFIILSYKIFQPYKNTEIYNNLIRYSMRPYTFLFVNNMLQIWSLYLPVSSAPSYVGERGPESQSALFPCLLLYFITYIYTSIVLYSFKLLPDFITCTSFFNLLSSFSMLVFLFNNVETDSYIRFTYLKYFWHTKTVYKLIYTA